MAKLIVHYFAIYEYNENLPNGIKIAKVDQKYGQIGTGWTQSGKFCPYLVTLIGRLEIMLMLL